MSLEETERERIWPVLAAIISGSFITILNISSINVAVPALMEHFDASLSLIQWTITGFMLAMGITAPLAGYTGERFSTKTVFIASLAGFTLFSLLCATATTPLLLIVYRIFQGAFTGLVGPTAMTIVYQVVPRHRQAIGISFWSLAAMLGPAIGPTMSGWILQHLEWNWLFWINVPLGIVAVCLSFLWIPKNKPVTGRSFDAAGLGAVLMGSLSLLVAFSEANSWGWLSAKTLSLLAVGIALIVLFLLQERRAPAPLLNIRVFAYKRYTLTLVIATIITVSLYSGTLLTSLFLQNVEHRSPLQTGLILLPASLIMALAMPVVGKLYEKFGPFWLVSSGIAMISAGTLALGELSVTTSPVYIIVWMSVRNVGFSLTMMPSSNAGMQAIPKELAGHGSSMSNWIRNVAGSFSVALFTGLLATRSGDHLAALLGGSKALDPAKQLAAETMGIDDVFLIAAAIGIIGLPVAFFLRGRSSRSTGGGMLTIQPEGSFRKA